MDVSPIFMAASSPDYMASAAQERLDFRCGRPRRSISRRGASNVFRPTLPRRQDFSEGGRIHEGGCRHRPGDAATHQHRSH
jgi:hypothetical protein